MSFDANLSNKLAQAGATKSSGVSKQAKSSASGGAEKLLDDSSSIFEALSQADDGAEVTKSSVKKHFQKAGEKGLGSAQQRAEKEVQQQLSEFSKLFEASEQADDGVLMQGQQIEEEGEAQSGKKSDKSSKQTAFEKQAVKSGKSLSQTQQTLTKEFASLYIKYLGGSAPGSDGQVEDMETNLRKEGFSHKDIKDLQQNVKKIIREQLKQQAQEMILQETLAGKDKWEVARAKSGMGTMALLLSKKDKLGGKDMGEAQGYDSFVKEGTKEALNEVKGFVQDLYQAVVLQKDIRQMGIPKEQVQNLQQLAQRCGFNLQQNFRFIEKLREDLGLDPVDLPEEEKLVDLHDDNPDEQGGGGKNKQQQKDQKESAVPKEVLKAVDDLRGAMIQEILKAGFKTKMDLFFVERQAKKILEQHKYPTEQILKELKQEAFELAKLHYYDQLKALVHERSTLISTKSNSYQNCMKSIEECCRRLKEMAEPIGAEQLQQYFDEANGQTFEFCRREVERIDAELEVEFSEKQSTRRKQLVEVMKKCKGETKTILDPVPESTTYTERIISEAA